MLIKSRTLNTLIPHLIPMGLGYLTLLNFTGEHGRTTYEHVGQFLAQCSEFDNSDIYRVRLSPLSLSSTAFTWFTSLAPNAITSWAQLEEKFHDYFYSGESELPLSDLTMVKQKYNEPVHDYIRRFRDVKNRCFNVAITERDLADLAFSGLLVHTKEKLEGHEFLDVSQVLQKALVQEKRVKEVKQSTRFSHNKEKVGPTVNTLECH